MDIEGWKYYNHAAIPTCAPHEEPYTKPAENGDIWKMAGSVLLARWTSDFDCKNETNWWYVIKDTPFDIATLNSKRRYEINKGNRNFKVKVINPSEFKEALYEIQIAAYLSWPKKYRPTVNRDNFIKSIDEWDYYKTYGAFSNVDGRLCGYALLTYKDTYIDFNILRVIPEYERSAINAAIVGKIVEDNSEFIKNGGYICDGSRSISHETAFQDYLEKYFGFRKAYCNLHVVYNRKFSWLVKILYPLRKHLIKKDNNRIIHKVNAVLKMETIQRQEDW